MVSEINGPGHPTVQGLRNKATATPEGRADAKPGTAADSSDVVSLTDVAARLQELTAAVRELPVVDQERVEHFRASIASGEYRVDDAQVADKLTELESMLSAPRS